VSVSRVRAAVASVLTAIVLLLAGLLVPHEAGAAPLRQRELASSGGWCWFGDPRGVYHEGLHRRTFVGWVSGRGDIQVASYDHDSGVRAIATLAARFQVDDHAAPSLLVLPDGHLLVFWSAHAGKAMFYRRSSQPEEVSAWGPERTIPTNTAGTWGYTYPNPVQLSAEGGRIWLLWRGGNFNRPSPPPTTTAPAGPRPGP